jgi:hypothetical protein
MQPGDYIIIVEDESPAQRVLRTGEKVSKRRQPSREHKVAFIDTVDKVNNKKVNLKNDVDAEFSADSGEEIKASRGKREKVKAPTRRAYLASPAFFPLPTGMQAKIGWVSLDETTLTAIKSYDKTVRASRGGVVR